MKKGYFIISSQLYQDYWDEIAVIFQVFKPEEIHRKYGDWVFYGESELFEPLKEGEMAPQYEILFVRDEDENVTYTFKRL